MVIKRLRNYLNLIFRVLFSVDIRRSDSYDFLDLCLKKAELLQQQSNFKPAVPAKLINSSLNVSPSSLIRVAQQCFDSHRTRTAPGRTGPYQSVLGAVPGVHFVKFQCSAWRRVLCFQKPGAVLGAKQFKTRCSAWCYRSRKSKHCYFIEFDSFSANFVAFITSNCLGTSTIEG